MKVHIFNEKSTNRPKRDVTKSVKTQGSGKKMKMTFLKYIFVKQTLEDMF